MITRFVRNAAAAVFWLSFAASAHAQSLSFQPKSGKDPIDVTADNFEIDQDTKRIFFRGHAKAVQGDDTVTGDVLIADYRTNPGGDNQVYRVFAQGNVTMTSNNQAATGDEGVYDFDKAVLVLEGDTVTMVSGDGKVTAHQYLQYWSNEHVAIAEGNADAIDKNKRHLYGDKLIAFFRDCSPPGGAQTPASGASPASKNGAKPAAANTTGPNATACNQTTTQGGAKDKNSKSSSDITYVQAFGHVRMETAKEVIRGERGDYNIDTGLATVEGSVKITGDTYQMNGGFALINVNGGRSRMFGSAAQAGKPSVNQNARVQALIAPKTKPDAAPGGH